MTAMPSNCLGLAVFLAHLYSVVVVVRKAAGSMFHVCSAPTCRESLLVYSTRASGKSVDHEETLA